MAQENSITYITEDIPASDSFIQSGRGLRLSYVARKEAKYINDILLQNIKTPNRTTDPTKISPEFWEAIRNTWKAEALIKYPDEGDYKVWIVDPKTGEAAPLGEVVEFIGGDVRENPGGKPCKEYTLDLSGATIPDPNTYYVAVSFEDCFLKQQKITDVASKMDGLGICVGRGVPYTSAGVLVEGAICDLNYGTTECSQYSWDLTGVDPGELVSLNFINCEGSVDKLQGTVRELGNPVVFCAEKNSAKVTNGTLNYVGMCTI